MLDVIRDLINKSETYYIAHVSADGDALAHLLLGIILSARKKVDVLLNRAFRKHSNLPGRNYPVL